MIVFAKSYLDKKAKKAKYDRLRREKDIEKYRKNNLDIYYRRKEKALKQEKIYRKENAEKIKIRKRKYYDKNKETIIKYGTELRRKKRLENPTNRDTTYCNYTISRAEKNKEDWLKLNIFLYKLELTESNGDIFYKYGLSKNIKERFYKIPYDIKIIELTELNLYDAVYKEKELLNSVEKYKPQNIFKGYTECFKN